MIGALTAALSLSVGETYEGVPVVVTSRACLKQFAQQSERVIFADSHVDGDALFDVMMRCGRRVESSFELRLVYSIVCQVKLKSIKLARCQ